MKNEQKCFYNPKTVVIKETNRKKKIMIDFRIAQKKYLLKLDESQWKKGISFELTFTCILQKGKEVSSERKFCISWHGGFRLMRWYEKLLVGPFSSCFTFFCLFKLFIFNEYFRVWANIFLGCVPFVCWSTFFLTFFIFSWAAKIFLYFSFYMFTTSADSFWDILYFSFVLSEKPYLLVNKTPALSFFKWNFHFRQEKSFCVI